MNKSFNLSLQYIQNVNFWVELNDLLLVLQFIHEQQKMSENNQVIVDKIYIYWIDIQIHLNQCIQSNHFDQAIKEFLQTQFTFQLTKQIMILHRVTHYLHSTHYNKSLIDWSSSWVSSWHFELELRSSRIAHIFNSTQVKLLIFST